MAAFGVNLGNDTLNKLSFILDAIQFAVNRHDGQRRKGDDTPYITHPIGVASFLIEQGKISNKKTIVAAILHDVLEDTVKSEDEMILVQNEIARVYGHIVLDTVVEVTDDKTLPKVERKKLQVKNAAKKSNRAKVIKIADKMHNCLSLKYSPPKGWSQDIIDGYIIWAWFVMHECAGANANLDAEVVDFWNDHVCPIILKHCGEGPQFIDVAQRLLEKYYKDIEEPAK